MLPKLCDLLHSPLSETWASERLPVLVAIGCQLGLLTIILWGVL